MAVNLLGNVFWVDSDVAPPRPWGCCELGRALLRLLAATYVLFMLLTIKKMFHGHYKSPVLSPPKKTQVATPLQVLTAQGNGECTTTFLNEGERILS